MRRSCAPGRIDRTHLRETVKPAVSHKTRLPVNRQRTFGKEAIHMARMHFQLIGLAALSFALTGCVTSTDKYQAAMLELESLRNQQGESQAQARAAMAERDALKGQIALMS